MVRVRFTFRGNKISGFMVSGHAGYERAGRNVPCAAVSSAVQMAVNTVTDVLGVEASVTVLENRITLRLPEDLAPEMNARCQAVLEGLRVHLGLLKEQFPGAVDVERK